MCNDPNDWSSDALDEEIFECEQTMVREYIDQCGRQELINYHKQLQDIRNKRSPV